jgi:hypothetical protein
MRSDAVEVPIRLDFPWEQTRAIADQCAKVSMAWLALGQELDKLSGLMERRDIQP